MTGCGGKEEDADLAASMALCWLKTYISSMELFETDKAKNLLEALAKYYLCLAIVDESESVKAGDMTIRSNSQKLIDAEEKLLKAAVAASVDILTDGGFVFETA